MVFPTGTLAGSSVDQAPSETNADPGDVFVPGLVCDFDDGDNSCGGLSLNLPAPGDFDLDAWAVDDALEVCPLDPQYLPGLLFSFDDGEPGAASAAPDHGVELFFYDHCAVLAPARRSYFTSWTEAALGLGGDPPPRARDDDVDAFDTREAASHYDQGMNILFSPDGTMNGGLGVGSESHIWFVNAMSPTPTVWATPSDLGVPDRERCDVDGIAPIVEDQALLMLFSTDDLAPCGLDPGDIYASDLTGNHWLWADDVVDLRIAVSELQEVDLDALAVNTPGEIEIVDPYDPTGEAFYKSDWPNHAPSGVPDCSQDHGGWPPTHCGPAAVLDALLWFDSELECDRDRTAGNPSEIESNDQCPLFDRLGEDNPSLGSLSGALDEDWWRIEIPGRLHGCELTVSTCARRQPGDADTVLTLFEGCEAGGVPVGLLASNDDGCFPDTQSEVMVQIPADADYFVRIAPSATSPGGPYTLTLGLDCYPLLERDVDVADDHDPHNPRELMEDLAFCMNTDDVQATGSGHLGTLLPDLADCVDGWLVSRGVGDRFSTQLTPAPERQLIEEQVGLSSTVVLLLGFYYDASGNWLRCGGHYVSVAGGDGLHGTMALSDPALNNAEWPPHGHLAPGRVRGPEHADHAPAVGPPPDHDDTANVSHDRYAVTPSPIGPPVSRWSLPSYGTPGGPTLCADVERWCTVAPGQNPIAPDQLNEPCPGPGWPISTEIEAMLAIAPDRTPLCVFLDAGAAWPDNLRVRKGGCGAAPTAFAHDVIRGKLCNLRHDIATPTVGLFHAECLADDALHDEFEEISPDDTGCIGGWYYLARRSGDVEYGFAEPPGNLPRILGGGGCP